MARTRVVVVGGGAAGLACAIFARRGGCDVQLLEAASAPGGRARTEEARGFLLNLGPRALYRSCEAAEVLSELGVPVSGSPPLKGGLALVGETLHRLPVGPWSLLRTGALSGRGKREMLGLLAGLGRLRTEALAETSVTQWLADRFRDETARRLMEALFRLTTYCADHHLASAGVALAQLRAAVQHNVLYLDGGWQSLVDALTETAEREGVSLRTGARVRRVETLAGRARGVVVGEGEALAADAVVLAVDPATATALLGDAAATARRQFSRCVRVRSACLDLGLSRLPVPQHRFALGVDRPSYLSVHSAVARLAPEGGALVHVARYLSQDEGGAEALPSLEAELDRVQPGWRDHVVVRKWRPNMTVTFGMPTADGGGLGGRPAVSDPDVAGLYYSGDWAGAKGLLLDAALASARDAAGELLEDLRLRRS